MSAEGLPFRLRNPVLLRQALTVPTSRVGAGDVELKQAKERLEFLGDAVLGFLTGDYLYQLLPEAPEGQLSALRGALVSTESLAEVAARAGITEALGIVGGQRSRGNSRLLASTLEAVVGALYVDGGLEEVDRWIGQLLAEQTAIVRQRGYISSKSRLQERTQALQLGHPTYEVVSAVGPVHEPLFTVRVRIGERVYGEATGPSRQAAELRAAEDALDRWHDGHAAARSASARDPATRQRKRDI